MTTKHFLVLFLLAISPRLLQAQQPLVWGADLDGGAPYIFRDSYGNLIGFEVEIKDALARELSRPIEFKPYTFESLLDGLRVGDIDFAMNGLEITPANRERARFTRPYYIYQLQLVVRNNETRIRSIQDCKEQKLTVGTLTGTAATRLMKEEGIAYRDYADQDGSYKDLQLGRGIDAVLQDLPIAIYYALPADIPFGHRYKGLRFVGQPFAEGRYGIAVRKDNEALATELDAALQRVIESGELKRILTKWELWNLDQHRLYERVTDDSPATLISFAECFRDLLDGALMTVFLTLSSMALAIMLGLPIAATRLYGPAPLRFLATLYVEFFRGIPVLLLVYFLYYGLPSLHPTLQLHPVVAAILAFGLNYAAYEAEIYRAGIGAIPVGQWEAAASLAMPPFLTFRRIIFPQALRTIIPPMTNDLIALFKDTSVVSVIAVVELSKQYQILTKNGGGFLQVGLTTAALYLIMSVPLGYLSRYLEKRWSR